MKFSSNCAELISMSALEKKWLITEKTYSKGFKNNLKKKRKSTF